MNATTLKPHSANGHSVPAGVTGHIVATLRALDSTEQDVHILEIAGRGTVPVPAELCHMHREPEPFELITPDQQITNVIESLGKWVSAPSTPGRMWNIKQAAGQLAEQWAAYRRGELLPIVKDVVPF